MPVNQCEFAKSKLLLFLSGKLDGTSDGSEFEKHVKSCPDCRELVSDKRKALQALIAAIDKDEQAQTPGRVRGSLFKLGKAKSLALWLGIAAGLILMGYFVPPGPALLGERASEDLAVHTQPEAPASPQESPKATSETETEVLSFTASAEAVEPTSTEGIVQTEPDQPQPKAPVSKRKKQAKHASAPPPQPPKTASEEKKTPLMDRVEVFDESGNKIGETVRVR